MHNFINGIGPPICIDLVLHLHEIHALPTRSAMGDSLHIPLTRLKTMERDFAIMASQIWNYIPGDIRQNKPPEQFKKSIKTVTWTALLIELIGEHRETTLSAASIRLQLHLCS